MEGNKILTSAKQLLWLSLCLSLVVLTGCAPKPPVNKSTFDHIDKVLTNSVYRNKNSQAIRPLPSIVDNALIPGVDLPMAHKTPPRRFDLSVNDVSAKTFFMSLVKGTDKSMVVSPEIRGRISLKLKNVTVDEVLESIRDVYGYDFLVTPVGYEVLPNQLRTKIFSVNYLDVERSGKSQTELSSGQITEKITGSTSNSATSTSALRTTTEQPRSGSSVVTRSKINFWGQLEKTLQAMLGEDKGHKVIINPQAGLVLVKAFPNELRQVASYLDDLQIRMDKQVILEVKILEINLKNNYQAGIDWQAFGDQLRFNALHQTSPFPNTNIDNTDAAFPQAFQALISAGRDFNVTIRALETQGNVQVLSNPSGIYIKQSKSGHKSWSR